MDIKVPQVGESIFEAQIARWHRQSGEAVKKDDLLCELETDKITLELNAEADGVLTIAAAEGETVKIGAVIGTLEVAKKADDTEAPAEKESGTPPATERKALAKKAAASDKPADSAPPPPPSSPPEKEKEKEPLSRSEPSRPQAQPSATPADREEKTRSERKPMTPIRRRIAERLLAARQQTAMLTTFNEADLSRVQQLRHQYQGSFQQRHGVKLGLMSFFVKACIEALRSFPEVNARIDGDDIVYQHFYDIGIAIGAEKGLVVPVLRDADRLHFADIEQAIAGFAEKIEQNRLAVADLEGGTFTISNGGIYGSLLSTPILNPPQSAVLGLHAIQDRPVVRDGQVVVRPMMYLALSYDHRLIDGRQAVGFLKRIKEFIETPEEMLLEL